MGWFDQENKDKASVAPAAATPAVTSRAEVEPKRPAAAGSTLGERIHINGTILSEEPLTILGHVEGTIRARQTLEIAQSANVKAAIHGKSVVVEGAVTGDVHGTDSVTLGPTAVLNGNISAPALHIHEGAFFKGAVEMPSSAPATAAPSPPPPARASKPTRERVAAEPVSGKREREAKVSAGT